MNSIFSKIGARTISYLSIRDTESLDKSVILLHVVIALSFGIGLHYLQGLLKVAVVPYLAYLLYLRRVEHLPALIIILGYGSILTIAASLMIIPLAVIELRKIEIKFIGRTIRLLLLTLPIFVLITGKRMNEGMSLIEALEFNHYYLSFWFLVYGALNHKYYSDQNIGFLVIFGLFLGLLIRFIPFVPDGIHYFGALRRQTFYFMIFSLIFVAYRIFVEKTSIHWLFWVLLLTVPPYILGSHFTFFFGLLLAIIVLIIWEINKYMPGFGNYFKEKIYPLLLILFPFLFLILTILLTSYALTEMEINVPKSGSASLLDSILHKLFYDRGVIWSGTLQGIIENAGILPPLDYWNISYTTAQGVCFEVKFGAHNLILGLIRKNGYLVGGLLISLFVYTIYELDRSKTFLLGNQRVLAISLIGTGLALFIVGQFIFQLNASFFFMSAIGGLIGYRQTYLQS